MNRNERNEGLAAAKRAGVLFSVSMSLNESVIYFKFREKMAEKRENLNKLQNAFASLTDDEKELIWLLYLCKEPLTESPLEHKYLPVIKNVLLKDNQRRSEKDFS